MLLRSLNNETQLTVDFAFEFFFILAVLHFRCAQTFASSLEGTHRGLGCSKDLNLFTRIGCCLNVTCGDTYRSTGSVRNCESNFTSRQKALTGFLLSLCFPIFSLHNHMSLLCPHDSCLFSLLRMVDCLSS